MKKLITIVLSIAIIFCSINFYTVQAENIEVTVSYDGNVKILSNIPTEYLKSEQNKRDSSTVIENFLKEIGYSETQIEKLSDKAINEYINAKKIYSISINDSRKKSRAIIDEGTLEIDTTKVEGVFSVIERPNKLNGKTAFVLKTVIDWKSTPVCRLTDIIAMAWSGGNSMSAGSTNSRCTMTYDRARYQNGDLLERVNDMDATSSCNEVNYFPGYAAEYNIPTDIFFNYTDFHLEAETMITAEDDFIACSGYGHQIIAGTPSVSVSSDETGSIGIEFNKKMDDFYFGIIRVFF